MPVLLRSKHQRLKKPKKLLPPVEETTEETTTEETTEETVEETVEASIWDGVTPAKNIVFWHQHTGEAREAAMQKIVDGFNETNEYGITLTAEYAGGYGDIYTKMLAILNTPPTFRISLSAIRTRSQPTNWQTHSLT